MQLTEEPTVNRDLEKQLEVGIPSVIPSNQSTNRVVQVFARVRMETGDMRCSRDKLTN